MLSRYTPTRTKVILTVLLDLIDGEEEIEPRRELKETLKAHGRVIEIICPKESVRLILGQALVQKQDKLGIRALQSCGNERWLIKSPCRSDLWKMGRVLDQGETETRDCFRLFDSLDFELLGL